MQNFSIPLNPKLDYDSFTKRFIPFLEKNKKYIYDVYFTSRIPPFGQDAMGDVFHQGDWGAISDNAIQIQEIIGIPVSSTQSSLHGVKFATFNCAAGSMASHLGHVGLDIGCWN